MVHTEYILYESEHDIGFFAENVLVFNGKTAIDNPPEVLEAMELQPHNMLAAHMFNVTPVARPCSKCRSTFPRTTPFTCCCRSNSQPSTGIKSSDNKPTYYVTPKTISYIYWIVTDCITRLPSDACTQHALQNEIMILEML